MKCVRRNLNFNDFPVKSSQNNHENKTQPNKLTLDEPINKKCSDSIRKGSLLLPPNTIKKKHLQKCTDKVNRYSKIPVIPNKIPLIDKENILKKEQKETEIVDILPLNKESHKINNSIMLFDNIKPPSENKGIKSGESESIQDLCSILQDTKIQLIDSENNMNMKHISSEMICINRDKIMSLECDLKNLLSVTEENVLKLKSILMCITKLVSGNDEKITLSKADVKKNHTELEKPSKIMVDKEVQVDTYNLKEQLEENVRTPIAHTSRINVTNIMSLNKNQNVESDQENYELINRRRISNEDGSFLELENQLNIKHTKPTQDSISLQKTPVVTRYKQKRSFREYMALKSSMRFLETPDGKKLKPLCQIDNIDNSILNATYISNKLLTDLHNLYAESPES